MLIDLRYHLTSLVAVFLALAVGILIGSSFIAGSSIEGLQQEIPKLHAENRAQQKTIEAMRFRSDRNAEFDRAVAPLLVHRQLDGQRLAIIQTGDYSEATQSAISILEDAGAKIASVTTLAHLDADSARERVDRASELLSDEEEDWDVDPVERILETLAHILATGSNSDTLDMLERKGLLTKAGSYDGRVLRVILVGGSNQRASRRPHHVDLVLIDKLYEQGVVTIVGVESLEAETSYVPAYQLKAVPTVDNVDQPIGQVALVFALRGEKGNFGVKQTADRIVPVFLESGQWRGSLR